MEAISSELDICKTRPSQHLYYRKLRHQLPLISVVVILILLWYLITSKLRLLPLPFFPGPDQILRAMWLDRAMLGLSTVYSLRLLAYGYLFGIVAGLITGILMGWFRQGEYWLQPVLRLIGPIPAVAWIPIAMVVFSTSFQASVFLLALSTWFPVTVLTWSGVGGVNKAYLDVARTLGAGERVLLRRVVLPAALPSIFVGLFMSLGISFATLIVAEMLGVKAGLGWYLQWAQGWAEYDRLYGALLIMAILFSTLLTVIFRIRDRFLTWQRGLIKW